jgi:hypothetical protein
MINNFHRLVWTLDKQSTQGLNLYAAGKPNRFWLVPHIHAGPKKKVGRSTYQPGSPCFVVEYEGTDMKSIWKNLKLFKAGSDLPGDPPTANEPPFADEDTFRLEAAVTMGGKKSIITLVVHPSNEKRLYINKTPKGMYEPSGEDGWGKADQ